MRILYILYNTSFFEILFFSFDTSRLFGQIWPRMLSRSNLTENVVSVKFDRSESAYREWSPGPYRDPLRYRYRYRSLYTSCSLHPVRIVTRSGKISIGRNPDMFGSKDAPWKTTPRMYIGYGAPMRFAPTRASREWPSAERSETFGPTKNGLKHFWAKFATINLGLIFEGASFGSDSFFSRFDRA